MTLDKRDIAAGWFEIRIRGINYPFRSRLELHRWLIVRWAYPLGLESMG